MSETTADTGKPEEGKLKKPRAERPSRKDIQFIDVTQMIPSYITNLREDYGDVEELVKSIMLSSARIPPLRGYKEVLGNYIITDGHRRMMAGFEAAKRTGKPVFLPFYNEPQGYTDRERLTDMFLLNEGKPLSMMEQAKGIKRFVDEYGLTSKEIAKLLHKSVTYIINCRLLVDAPEDIKAHITSGLIRPSLVIDLMKEMPIEQVSSVINDTIENLSQKPKPQNQSKLEFHSSDGDHPVNSTFNALDANATATENTPSANGAFKSDNYDDGEPIILRSPEEDHFRNSDGGGIISELPVRVTKKDIDNTLEKFNSLSAFKRMLKKYPDTTFNPRVERAEELVFFQNVIEGNISGHDVWNRYFQISSEAALKEELENKLG